MMTHPGYTGIGGAYDDVRSRPRRVARQLVLETRAQGTASGRSRRLHAYPDRRRRAFASHLAAGEPRDAHRRRRQPDSLGRPIRSCSAATRMAAASSPASPTAWPTGCALSSTSMRSSSTMGKGCTMCCPRKSWPGNYKVRTRPVTAGRCRRSPLSSFRSQRRSGVGRSTMHAATACNVSTAGAAFVTRYRRRCARTSWRRVRALAVPAVSRNRQAQGLEDARHRLRPRRDARSAGRARRPMLRDAAR